MNGNGAWIAVAICCFAIPALFVALLFGPLVLLTAGIVMAAVVLSRGGRFDDIADVIRQGFPRRDGSYARRRRNELMAPKALTSRASGSSPD